MLRNYHSVVCGLVLLISPLWTHAENHGERPPATGAGSINSEECIGAVDAVPLRLC